MTKLKDLNLKKLGNLIAQRNHSDDVTYTGWLWADGKVKESGNTACHAALGRGPANCDAVWTQLQDHRFSDQKEKIFVDYMLKESPWKDVFLNPTHEHVKTYGFIADSDADAHMVVNALVATRLISEWPSRFEFFLKAINFGMTKDYAMILSQFCEDSYNTFYIAHAGGHAFTYDCSKEIVKRFVRHDPFIKEGRSYRKSPRYNRLCDVWDAANGGFGEYTTSVIRTIPEYKMVSKVNHNIFYSPKNNGNYTYHSYETSKYFEEKVKEKLVA